MIVFMKRKSGYIDPVLITTACKITRTHVKRNVSATAETRQQKPKYFNIRNDAVYAMR